MSARQSGIKAALVRIITAGIWMGFDMELVEVMHGSLCIGFPDYSLVPTLRVTAIKLRAAPLKSLPFVLRYRSMNGRDFSGLRFVPFTLRYLSANGTNLNLMAVTLRRWNG
jgi:hypothetical protein